MKANKHQYLKLSFISLNILNILDIITTLIAVKIIGLIETNPLMDLLIQWGPSGFAVIKLGIGLGCGVILYKARSKWGFVACNLIFLYAVISNVIHILN